ncbi:lipopolysaccharide biosynthesis protein [Altererythrobacter sp. CAU 1778]
MKHGLRHKVAGGAAMLAVARICSRGFDFVTLIVLARHLTPSDFGLVAIALSVVQITEAVMEMPTGSALLQLRSVKRSLVDAAFSIALIRALLLITALCALSVPLARFFGDDRLIALICALSLAPAIRALRSPKLVLLYRHMRFAQDAAADVVGKLCALVVAVSLALSTESYWAIAAATIAGPFFYVLASYVLVPARPHFTLRHYRFFYGYLGWSMGAQTVSALNWQTDRFMLGKLASQATVGLFSTTRDLAATTHKALLEAMQRPLMSALSRSNRDVERQRAVYGMSIATVLSIAMPIAVGQALLAQPLIALVLGPQWLGATIVFQAVSLALIPGLYSHMTLTLLYAAGKPRHIFTRNLQDFALRVPLTIVLIMAFGWIGAVAALVIADLFLAGLCIHLARKVVGIGMMEQVGKAGRGVLSALVMAGVVFGLQSVIAPPEGTIGILLYLAKIVPLAAATYWATHWAIWWLSGKPDGVERLAIQTMGLIVARLPRRAAQPI